MHLAVKMGGKCNIRCGINRTSKMRCLQFCFCGRSVEHCNALPNINEHKDSSQVWLRRLLNGSFLLLLLALVIA